MSDARKIMIAVDGSSQADYAFDWCLNNLYKDGDVVYVVTCSEYTPSVFLPGAAMKFEELCKEVKENQDAIDVLLNGFTEKMRQKKIAFQARSLSGKPGEALMKFAEDEKVGMVVLGTRGLGSVRRTLMGSVSDFMVHNCKRPVVVVRNDQ